MTHHFFAYLSRMKYIARWGLMRNTRPENVQEHSLQVAMVAHALALIRNRRYGGRLDPERVMALAVYHEAGEVITGDLATPVKYFNPEIKEAFKRIESIACGRILRMLPEDLRADYEPLINQPTTRPTGWSRPPTASARCSSASRKRRPATGNSAKLGKASGPPSPRWICPKWAISWPSLFPASR